MHGSNRIEGTWEEVTRRAGELAGHRVRIIVFDAILDDHHRPAMACTMRVVITPRTKKNAARNRRCRRSENVLGGRGSMAKKSRHTERGEDKGRLRSGVAVFLMTVRCATESG